MERLRNMGLRRSFFLLSVVCLSAALLLTAGIYMACDKLGDGIPRGGIAISYDGGLTSLEEPSPRQQQILEWLFRIPLLAAMILPVGGLGLAGALFYRWKLKAPIRILQEGTERIRMQDLDFTIPAVSGDELGQICAAFETMRRELLKSNQELWRQAEERRRLNAAFSHDLRNPVTVLKGTVKLLRQDSEDAAGREQAFKRLETYTLRIERYVEAMSSIQRLEQMPVHKKTLDGTTLRQELEETAALLAAVHRQYALPVSAEASSVPPVTGGRQPVQPVMASKPSMQISVLLQGVTEATIDHGIFLTVAENLIGNAVRFAKQEVKICLRQEGRGLVLSVWDDGPGYPAWIVKEGPKPFGKVTENTVHFGKVPEDAVHFEKVPEDAVHFEKAPEDTVHFGMGLYSSQILCGKHGGALRLENGRGEEGGGARATAVFEG